MNPQILLETITTKMPFGKYKNTIMADLPIEYLEWFHRQGFPKGKLGMLMSTVYEIKINGLESIIYEIKKMHKGESQNN